MSATYIPAGTRLAVRDSKGVAVWYTTKKDVPVAGTPATVRCPMGTGRDVLTVTHEGFTVFFVADCVRTRMTASEAASLQALKPCLAIYDIPDAADIANPSGWLSRIAVRVNLSCWVIPEDRIPYARFHALSEAGATWHIVRFDPSEAAKLIDMAVVSLRREIADAVRRADATRATIDAELAAAETDPAADIVAMRKRATARAEQVQKRVRDLIDNLTAAAGVFGIDTRSLDIAGASTAVAAISTAMRQRAAAFADAARLARETAASGSAAVAALVEADAIPAGVVADFIDDHGGDAAALRAAFADGDDGTFSLAGTTDDAA